MSPPRNAKETISNNMLYVRDVYLTKGHACSQETNPSSRQRGCYVRTIAARIQLKKESGCGSQAAWRPKMNSDSDSDSDDPVG
jgi:hypothetical protein